MSNDSNASRHYNNFSCIGTSAITSPSDTAEGLSPTPSTLEPWRSGYQSFSNSVHHNPTSITPATNPMDIIWPGYLGAVTSTAPPRAFSSSQNEWICFLCLTQPYRYKGEVTLKRHLEAKHLDTGYLVDCNPNQSKVKLWGCGLCVIGECFSSKENLLSHITKQHSAHTEAFCHWDTSKVMHNLLHHPALETIYKGKLAQCYHPPCRPIWEGSIAAITTLRTLQEGLDSWNPTTLVEDAMTSVTGCCEIANIS